MPTDGAGVHHSAFVHSFVFSFYGTHTDVIKENSTRIVNSGTKKLRD